MVAARAFRLRTAFPKLGAIIRLLGLTLLALMFPPAGQAGKSNASSGLQLFVTTLLSNSVAVIDTTTNQVSTTIPVGNSPKRLAMTPDGLKAYVANSGSDSVSVIDTVNRVCTKTVPTEHAGPQELTVTPDGSYVFVVHENSGYVVVIDTATDTLIQSIPVDGTNCRDLI